MTIKFTNNATTTLASGITNVATSLTVASGKGALFPTLTGSDVFYATLANTSGTVEIVKVTARSTDTFTVVRGQDGTTAVAWNAGDKVELRVVAADLGAMLQTADLPASAVTSAVAGTGISVSAATGAVTFTNSAPDQTVSLAAGSGISVTGTYPNFTIATSGGGGVTSLNGQTGAVVTTSYNAIGSCVAGAIAGANVQVNVDNTYAGSSIINITNGAQCTPFGAYASNNAFSSFSKTGTWRAMNSSRNGPTGKTGAYGVQPTLWMRIS